MIKRPKDVLPSYFDEMMSVVPDGAKFIKSRRKSWYWEFLFLLNKPSGSGKTGDTISFSVPLKIK